jgi:hypothetical protein
LEPRLQFHDLIARLQREARPQLLEHARRERQHARAELGRTAIVQRQRLALVLEQQPRVGGDELDELVAHRFERLAPRRHAMDRAEPVAALEAVHARRRQLQRREQRVDLLDRPAADHGQRAVERIAGARQQARQRRIDPDRVGRLGEIEQRAVEVDEQAESRALREHPAYRLERGAGAVGRRQREAPAWRREGGGLTTLLRPCVRTQLENLKVRV